MEQVFCQSCAMPMSEADYGENLNGSKNQDYCHYCFANGHFTKEETMEEMINTCVPFVLKDGVYPDEESAIKGMLAFFPTLKRWRKD